MKIKVELKETADPIEHDALNSYTKGPFFCIFEESGEVVKYPLQNIWRVVHQYSSARTDSDNLKALKTDKKK